MTLGVVLAPKRVRASRGPGPRGRRSRRQSGARAQRVRAHRRRQHRHRHREAHRDGPGHVHRTADAGGGGARRRLVADPRRGRARRRQALQQPVLGPGAGHRRQHRDRQLVRAAAQGRRGRARHARCGGGAAVERAAGQHHGVERRRVAQGLGAQGDLRRARGVRVEAAGAAGCEAQGREGLRLHRQARAAHRQPRQDHRHRAVHAGREAAGHADRGGAACAALRRQGEIFRRRQGEGDAARRRRRADPVRRRGAGAGFLVGEAGPRCADGRVGRNRRVQARLGRDHGRLSQARREARACRRARTATPRRRSPPRRRRSRPNSSFRTSRTPRWSR